MSVDVTNETQWVIDPKVFSDLGIWVLDQMRVSTQSDLTIMFVDPDPIAELHMRWMSLEGPTDVMSFPMDELRPGDGKTVMEGVLGDIVICPWVAAQQAAAGTTDVRTAAAVAIDLFCPARRCKHAGHSSIWHSRCAGSLRCRARQGP